MIAFETSKINLSEPIWIAFLTFKQNVYDFHPHIATNSDAVVYWLSMRSHNAGVVSLIPPFVTVKMPLVRKVTGNHLIKSTSLEKTQNPVSGFCYAQN